ncbi:MarR family winged helix-turn-helix transcriptional regulator [Roseobacter sinensis]|uniref:MarR family winged helix-turn-helix transcriptional regulator n=1 Tax=Roseobacter sinensis TaxID=2931391 RepID=A0ABT3BJU7_9RHOB|nr:MarR family winged helix-turn-helix transcriptional regulator [Roseobacter sp. WL0113]MCV3273844.1 MarR family winged helix-turn-helix transcriptional regulator [Roseobacter sp. WL0113]
MPDADFNLSEFLPYLLNQAADRQSMAFSPAYRARYGMLRTEWRVLFHLGQYGEMTAKRICEMAQLHKTKASRAVAALEAKRFLRRREVAEDRRHALLRLTPAGRAAYAHLYDAARAFDMEVQTRLTVEDARVLKRCLIKLAASEDAGGP